MNAAGAVTSTVGGETAGVVANGLPDGDHLLGAPQAALELGELAGQAALAGGKLQPNEAQLAGGAAVGEDADAAGVLEE